MLRIVASILTGNAGAVVVPRALDALVDGVHRLRTQYEIRTGAARLAAVTHFDARRWVAAYADVYAQVGAARA